MASSSFFSQEKQGPAIIFARLDNNAARSILRQTIENNSGEGEPFAWLITEGESGKLKIHYTTFGMVGSEMKWDYGTLDLVHTKNGWRLIGPLERSDVESTMENIDQHNVSLMQEINKIPSIQLLPYVRSKISPLVNFENFQQPYLITPKGERASRTYLYCWEEAAPTPMSFLCAGTGKLLEDPVMVVNPKTPAEKKGETYERAYLLARGYTEYSKNNQTASFVSDRALKDVIKAVGKGELSALEVALKDPISHDILTKPTLAPSGNSYSEGTINQWLSTSNKEPLTNQVMSRNELFPNLALQRFIEQNLPSLQDNLSKQVSVKSSKGK